MAQFNLGLIIEKMFKKLGNRFSITTDPLDRSIAFGVSEKLKTPMVDDKGRATNWKTHGWIKKNQLMVIANTSSSEQEVEDRIIQLTMHGNDTTRYMEQIEKMTPDKIEEIVQKKLAELLAKHSEKLAKERDADRIKQLTERAARDAMIEATTEEPEPQGVKKGIQHKERKSVAAYAAEIDAENALWEERAKMLGIDPPVKRTRDRRIDLRWIRRVKPLWDARNKGQVVSST